jgi:hypothetical protein
MLYGRHTDGIFENSGHLAIWPFKNLQYLQYMGLYMNLHGQIRHQGPIWYRLGAHLG